MPNDTNLLYLRAQTHFSMGEYSRGLPLVEEVARQQPDNMGVQGTLGWGLAGTHQLERLAESPNPFQRILALSELGRNEEALMLARQQAATGEIATLFGMLNITGRHTELVKYLEARWNDLAAFQADFPNGSDGYWLMNDVALAYSKTGNEERFRDAMSRIRAAHDQLLSAGIKDSSLYMQEALYFSMAGEYESALEYLGKSIDGGFIAFLRIARSFPQLEPLEGDPRFEAIQARMIDKLNTERAALGLEPASI
jgi:tetratricopeptide (TPR) repeat protein